jgi:hypothetical protein
MITIKLLNHYGNFIMIPVKCVVDVYMKRTFHNKMDKANFNKHLKNTKIFIITIIRITFCSLPKLDTIKTNKEAIHCMR